MHGGSSGPGDGEGIAPTPVRLGVFEESELVATGLAAMLRRFAHRVQVSDFEPLKAQDFDVVLVDPFDGLERDDQAVVQQLVNLGAARVVVYTWRLDRVSVDRAFAAGACGYVSKSLGAGALVAAVESVHTGNHPIDLTDSRQEAAPADPPGDPGLSPREEQVLSLIQQGLSNQEIAEALYVSANSVKTYIRQLYRKLGVTRRSQAVAFAMEADDRRMAPRQDA
jgi:two-component system, NarL family, response regulator LiaR